MPVSRVTPTHRTLVRLREDGWAPAIVERWNPFAQVRQDAWGILDIIAIKRGEPPLGIQCTSSSNVASRLTKMAGLDVTQVLIDCGWRLEVWGWRQDSGQRWIVRRMPVEAKDEAES